ncbi:hypothetical protein FTX61_14080 [Nitriliruptoraceae bacterium ZYF776]|nr:hypothetical protein [Profundirhabdus halotolerans]
MDATASGTLQDVLTLQHGFRPTASGPIGIRHGLPVRVAAERNPQRNNQKVLRFSIGTADLPTAQAAVAQLQQERKQFPVKLHGVEVVEGGLIVDLPPKLDKSGHEGLAALDGLTQRIAQIPGAVPVAPEGAQLTTVDGVPRWLTAADRQAIEAQARAEAEAYAAIKPNVPGGLIAGSVAALVTAGAWATLYAYANARAWFVAILGGLLISFVTIKVGRRTVLPLQVGVFVLALAAVALGEVLGLALEGNRYGAGFDVSRAFDLYMRFLGDNLSGVLFALGGGVVGAVIGLQAASKPTFDRAIEVH